jgi:hypothetical protein
LNVFVIVQKTVLTTEHTKKAQSTQSQSVVNKTFAAFAYSFVTFAVYGFRIYKTRIQEVVKIGLFRLTSIGFSGANFAKSLQPLRLMDFTFRNEDPLEVLRGLIVASKFSIHR